MLALIQRVSQASVIVDSAVIGEIDQGLLVFLGVQKGDNQSDCKKLAEKVSRYRVFADPQGRMNCSVRDINGAVLIVSQFTLAADTQKGLRPSFTAAALPEDARPLYDYFVCNLEEHINKVETGQFGADMKVSLCNDGPVTFLLNT